MGKSQISKVMGPQENREKPEYQYFVKGVGAATKERAGTGSKSKSKVENSETPAPPTDI